MAFDQNDFLTTQALRLAETAWPGTLTYAGQDFPCAIGEQQFFDRLMESGGGFNSAARIMITLRRSNIPDTVDFKSGQNVTLRNLRSGESRPFRIGAGQDIMGREENTNFDGNIQLCLVSLSA